MSARRSTAERRAELVDELEQLAAAKSAWWDALRQANAEVDGRRMSRLLAESAEIDERAERLRRRHFPRAGKLCVLADATIGQAAEAFTVSPRGRSVRTVWTASDGLAA